MREQDVGEAASSPVAARASDFWVADEPLNAWKLALGVAVITLAVTYDLLTAGAVLALALAWRQAAIWRESGRNAVTTGASVLLLLGVSPLALVQARILDHWPAVPTVFGPPLPLVMLVVQASLLGDRVLGVPALLCSAGYSLMVVGLFDQGIDPAIGWAIAAADLAMVIASGAAVAGRAVPLRRRRADVLVVAGLALLLGYTLPYQAWGGGREVTIPVVAEDRGSRVALNADLLIGTAINAKLPGYEIRDGNQHAMIFEPAAPGKPSRPVGFALQGRYHLQDGQVALPISSCCDYSHLTVSNFPAPTPQVLGRALATLRVFPNGREDLVSLEKVPPHAANWPF